LLGFVASLLIARALGPADFGIFSVLAATVAIVGAVVDGGLSEAAVLRLAQAPALAVRRGNAFFWLRLGLAALGVLVLGLLAEPIAQQLLGVPAGLLRWALLGVVASASSGAISTMLQASGKFGRMSALTLSNTGLTAVLALGLTAAGQLNLLTALVVLGVATSLATLAVGVKLLPHGWDIRRPREIKQEATELQRLGKWLWLAAVLAMLATNLDLLVLNHWSTPAVVGAYALALNLASKVNVVNHSLYTVLLPSVAQVTDARRYLRQGVLRTAPVAVGLILAIVLAEPFVVIAYGQAFEQAVPLLRALLALSILDVLLTPVLLLPLAHGRARLLAGADALRAGTLGGLALALVPSTGTWGAVIARAGARLAGAILVIAILTRSRPPFEVEHEESASIAQAG
jgi:O-antigen/teichoic acid export membrane protein